MASSTALRGRVGARRRTPLSRARRDARAGLAMVSPTFIVILVMVVLPVLWAVVLSFKRIRLIQLQTVDLFSGPFTLRNYDMLFGSSEFAQALRTTPAFSVVAALAT